MSLCHKTKPSHTIDILSRQSVLVSLRLKTIRSAYLETIMGTISAASHNSPVQVLSTRWAKPPDDGNSFGSDFQRLGSVAKSPLGSTGKPWKTYPMRPRSLQANSGIPLGSWCGERDRELIHAGRLKADPLMPKFIGERVERWRNLFVDSVKQDVTFERERATAMQCTRHSVLIPVTNAYVRKFDVGAVRAQLGEIAHLSREVRKLSAALPSLPSGSVT